MEFFIKRGGGTGPVKPGNRYNVTYKVLIPAKREALGDENAAFRPRRNDIYHSITPLLTRKQRVFTG